MGQLFSFQSLIGITTEHVKSVVTAPHPSASLGAFRRQRALGLERTRPQPPEPGGTVTASRPQLCTAPPGISPARAASQHRRCDFPPRPPRAFQERVGTYLSVRAAVRKLTTESPNACEIFRLLTVDQRRDFVRQDVFRAIQTA